MTRLFRLSYILLIMTLSGCSSLGSFFEEKDSTVGLTASQLYAQGKEFLRKSTQVKNIWIPYGE